MKVGYARTSTGEQDLRMQIDALEKAGCRPIYYETASGARAEREELANCLKFLREEDTLVVWAIDRLGRSHKDLINIICDLKERKIGFMSLSQNIDTGTSMGQLMYGFFSMMAEFERVMSVERTKAGLAAARARGRLGGRRYKHSEKQRELIKEMYQSKKFTLKEICEMHKISMATVYNYIK